MPMLVQALDDVPRGCHVVFDQEKFHALSSHGSNAFYRRQTISAPSSTGVPRVTANTR
jgi:hypothetical protein